MRKNRGIFVGMTNETIKNIIEAVSLKAFAEDGEPDGNGGADDDSGAKAKA